MGKKIFVNYNLSREKSRKEFFLEYFDATTEMYENLDNYINQLRNNEDSPFCMLYAQAGQGKSTFIHWLSRTKELTEKYDIKSIIIDVGNYTNNFDSGNRIEPFSAGVKDWLKKQSHYIKKKDNASNCELCIYREECSESSTNCIGFGTIKEFFDIFKDTLYEECIQKENYKALDLLYEDFDSLKNESVKEISVIEKMYPPIEHLLSEMYKDYIYLIDGMNNYELVKFFILFISYLAVRNIKASKNKEKLMFIVHFDNLDVIYYEWFKNSFLQLFDKCYYDVIKDADELLTYDCEEELLKLYLKFTFVIRKPLKFAIGELFSSSTHRNTEKCYQEYEYENYDHFNILGIHINKELKQDPRVESAKKILAVLQSSSCEDKIINLFNRDIQYLMDFLEEYINNNYKYMNLYEEAFTTNKCAINSILYFEVLKFLYKDNPYGYVSTNTSSTLLKDLIDKYFIEKGYCNIYRMLLTYLLNSSTEIKDYDKFDFNSSVKVIDLINAFKDYYSELEILDALTKLFLGNRQKVNTSYWNSLVVIKNLALKNEGNLCDISLEDLKEDDVEIALQPAGAVFIRHIFINFEFFNFIMNKQQNTNYRPLFCYIEDFDKGLELIEKVRSSTMEALSSIHKFNQEFFNNASGSMAESDRNTTSRDTESTDKFLEGKYSYKQFNKDKKTFEEKGVLYAARIIDNHLYHIDGFRIVVNKSLQNIVNKKSKAYDHTAEGRLLEFNRKILNIMKEYVDQFTRFKSDENSEIDDEASKQIRYLLGKNKYESKDFEKHVWRSN